MTTPVTTTLRALTATTETLLSQRLRPIGITVPQMEFLAAFAENPGACGAEVARECHVTPQTGTSILGGLTRRGLIKSEWIPGTGRRLAVTVTPAGHRTLAKARAATQDVVGKLGALLGPESAARMQEAVGFFDECVAEARATPKPKARVERPRTATKAKATAKKAKPAKRTTAKKKVPAAAH